MLLNEPEKSRGGVILSPSKFGVRTGEFSLLPPLRLKKPSKLLIGEIVRSGDKVILCVIDLNGDDGESRL